MKILKFTFLLPIILPIFLIGCDSKELTQKREQQEVEIARLKGELKLVEEQIKNLPPDRAKELAAIRAEEKEQLEQIETLESEVAELKSRKDKLETEFENYRAKYVVK